MSFALLPSEVTLIFFFKLQSSLQSCSPLEEQKLGWFAAAKLPADRHSGSSHMVIPSAAPLPRSCSLTKSTAACKGEKSAQFSLVEAMEGSGMSSPAALPGAMVFLGAGKTQGSQKQLLLAAPVPPTPSSQSGAPCWEMLGDGLLLP